MQMDSLGTRNLDLRLKIQPVQDRLYQEGCLARFENIRLISWVEVKDHHGWNIYVWRFGQKRMDFQIGHVGRPDEGRQIVDQNVIDHRFSAGSRNGVSLDQSGVKEGASFS